MGCLKLKYGFVRKLLKVRIALEVDVLFVLIVFIGRVHQFEDVFCVKTGKLCDTFYGKFSRIKHPLCNLHGLSFFADVPFVSKIRHF